ncbi:MAG: hypothetical protein D6708_12905 [Candidatus Dadabacteria bacterium]|nr:MAG: hypothetical protein D6708_12905 [Candidatus Dadabacteria bacterium]
MNIRPARLRSLAFFAAWLAVVSAGLWGWFVYRASACAEMAVAHRDRGEAQEALRAWGSAIRFHVPGSPVTREAATALLGEGEAALARGDRDLALWSFQALSASLEAVSRPLPVLPRVKARADQALSDLLGVPVPRPFQTRRWTWVPPVLFVGWGGLVLLGLLGRVRPTLAFPPAAILYAAWLAALRFV